jgi:hypothetical protein
MDFPSESKLIQRFRTEFAKENSEPNQMMKDENKAKIRN